MIDESLRAKAVAQATALNRPLIRCRRESLQPNGALRAADRGCCREKSAVRSDLKFRHGLRLRSPALER